MKPASGSSQRKIYTLIVGYSIALAALYMLPVWSGGEWYELYSYLDRNGAVPYVDVREGYPPLGFLAYMPIYYALRGNPAAFNYAFRALNGVLLVAALFTLYMVFRSMLNGDRALRLTLYYAAAPSVIIANTYSNDVVAMLPAALAIYMMVRGRASACGILVGIATLGKGFPILLLIPAFMAFTDCREKLKLVGWSFMILVFASLPFALMGPLTYLSTFTHHGSRGPWETVWALIEGYYSHGGLLHPYFDKFLYHQNLLRVYPASPYDHAVYEWKFGLMPSLLTLGQVSATIALPLFCKTRRGGPASLCGLLYVANMLFFKGYSTQFAVSTPFYVILAAADRPLSFLAPLEFSHIMQILSWNAQALAPEFMDAHSPMLMSAIIIRTAVFASLVMGALMGSGSRTMRGAELGRCLTFYRKLLGDRLLALMVSATLLASLSGYSALHGYVSGEAGFRSFSGLLTLTQEDWGSIRIDGLSRGDQVIVRLDTGSLLDARLVPDGPEARVERGVRNPYNLAGSFNETILFFVAGSESCSLMLRMRHAKTPFRVTDWLGDLEVGFASDGSTLMIKLRDLGVDGHGSVFRVAYPCRASARDGFEIGLRYRVTEGSVSKILLDVFDDTDEWLYAFATTQDFTLTRDTRDTSGHAGLSNDDVSLVALVFSMDDGSSATVRLEELSIGGSSVRFYAEGLETIRYEVFVERDFKPSIGYAASLISAAAFAPATIHYLASKRPPQRLLRPYTGESDASSPQARPSRVD